MNAAIATSKARSPTKAVGVWDSRLLYVSGRYWGIHDSEPVPARVRRSAKKVSLEILHGEVVMAAVGVVVDGFTTRPLIRILVQPMSQDESVEPVEAQSVGVMRK